MVTASADTTAKLWDVPTGKNYFTFDFDRQGARGTAFSAGGRQVVITVDPFMGTGSSIRIFKMFEDRAERARHAARCAAAETDARATAAGRFRANPNSQRSRRCCRSLWDTRGASRASPGAR